MRIFLRVLLMQTLGQDRVCGRPRGCRQALGLQSRDTADGVRNNGLQRVKRVLSGSSQRSTGRKQSDCRWGEDKRVGSAQSADTKTPGKQLYATVERWRPSKHRHLMAFLNRSRALIGRTGIGRQKGWAMDAMHICSARTNDYHSPIPPVA